MHHPDLLRRRLATQHVSSNPLQSSGDVVHSLVAVQSQDYIAARWAVGQRVAGATGPAIDEAFDRGEFLRTHVMRPTWHFVAPADLRWLLALTAPRVNAMNAYYYRTWGLDARLFARSANALRALLQGGRHLTRPAIVDAFKRRRLLRPGDPSARAIGLLMRAELDGLICSGPRQDRQFTYALLEERVARAGPLGRERARAAFARRFFVSHGPATVKDFAWWSGLTAADACAGLEAVQAGLERETIDGQDFWFGSASPTVRRGSPKAYMVPAYDESLIAYRDARQFFKVYATQLTRDFGQLVVIDGRALGSWRRAATGRGLVITVTPFVPLTSAETRAIQQVVARYGRFHHLDAGLALGGAKARAVSSRASTA